MAIGMASETNTPLARWLGAGLAPLEHATSTAQLQERQRQAAAQLQELRLPDRRDEEWRFTDISELAAIAWQPATEVPEVDITPWALPETEESRLVFVNGRYVPSLTDTSALPAEVVVGNLATLGDRALAEYFAADRDDTFATLNAAGFNDAAIVWVPRNRTVEQPIQLLFVAAPAAEPVLVQPRILIVAEDSATVSVVEQFVSLADAPPARYFTNAVTEIALGQNARVTHTRLQEEAAADGFHIGQTRVRQNRDSHYTSHAIATGARFSRHNLKVSLEGEQTETTLNGLSVTNGDRLSDTHSDIVHHYPHGTSNQLHKCLLDERSRSVFNGKIFVPQAAQQTNAAQLNRNLLLSPQARVDTKPQLQIVADNVKCAHGATVSQLEADEVFYLRSRGLADAAARRLLVDAFAGEVLQKLPIASLRDRLTSALFT